MVGLTEPWSKKHKQVTRAGEGGLSHSLSNSYTEPLSHRELVQHALARGDQALVDTFNDHELGYTPNGGSLDLREEIAKLYGPAIGAENILVFTGAQVALQTAAFALARGCHSIVFTPGYQSTVEAAVHAGGEVTRIPLEAARGWQIDPEEVAAAIRPDTGYMVLNEPYNPAGTLMSHELQSELTSIAQEHGITILSDEVYRLLEHDEQDRLPAMADLYSHGISAVTLSKPWGGCGITIGWLALQDMNIKQQLIDVQYFGTACPGRATELQAIMTLRASDAILDKNLAIIRRNLDLLDHFMEKYSDFFEWVRPKAGAIAFIKFKGPMSSEEFGAQLAKSGIGIKPAYCFTDVVTDDIDYFRVVSVISNRFSLNIGSDVYLGYGESVLPAALNALIEFVEENREKWTCVETAAGAGTTAPARM